MFKENIKYTKIANSILCIGLCFVLSNCKIVNPSDAYKAKALPSKYADVADSSGTADVDWSKYFTSPDLINLIDSAMVYNPDLVASLQRIEMARANVKYAKGQYMPQLTISGGAGLTRFGKYTSDGVGNFDTNFSSNIDEDQKMPEHLPDFMVGLQSSWELDVWGKLRNKKRAAVARYLASFEGRKWLVTNLVSEIAFMYYELLALDKELTIVRETIVLQEDELEIIRTQKEAGRTNELVVKQFEAQVLNSKGLETELVQRIVESENRLNYLLGRFPQQINRDSTNFVHTIPPAINVGLPAELLKNRPDIKQAEYELVATKADVKAARAAFYPSVNITGSGGFNAFNAAYFLSPQSYTYNLFGGLTAPLLNRSAIQAGFNYAKASQVEAYCNYQKSIINGYVDVYNQMVNINNLEKIYKQKNEEVAILTNAIQTSHELYMTGRASYLEILITRKNALQANIALIEIKQRQYNALINLYRALGGGWK